MVFWGSSALALVGGGGNIKVDLRERSRALNLCCGYRLFQIQWIQGMKT